MNDDEPKEQELVETDNSERPEDPEQDVDQEPHFEPEEEDEA